MLCSVCESSHFENIDGFYYCTVCGTKSQNVVDIEHSEEEIEHAGHELESRSERKRAIQSIPDEEADLGANFTTFHVYTRLLKRQCDDLVKLNANPLIGEVVLTLWKSYLKKLDVRLGQLEDEIDVKSKKWLRWERDKLYYQLNNNTIVEDEMELDDNQDSDDLNGQEEEYSSDGQTNNEASSSSSRKPLPLYKFEWVRMPHTIVILNLGLLLLKSQILLTDVIRFINKGQVAYFNIDDVLPDTMRFIYGSDSIMFNVTSLPRADQLRLLTLRLGKFLGLRSIELIPLDQICSRYIFDLNLPTQFNELVRLLLVKIKPPEELYFVIDSNELSINLEGIALSYIYSTILIVIFYKFEQVTEVSQRDFVFTEWLDVMLPCLKQARHELLGYKLDEARSHDELKKARLAHFKHRHKTNTKVYISQYRRKDLLDTLRKPLENTQDHEKTEMSEHEVISNKLFYIITKLDDEDNIQVSRSIASYITDEKLDILGSRGSYKSEEFEKYLEQSILNKKQRGAYLIGVKYSGLDWLLDRFHELSQTGGESGYFKLYDLIKRILAQLK